MEVGMSAYEHKLKLVTEALDAAFHQITNLTEELERRTGENGRLAHALDLMTLKCRMLEQQRDDAEQEMCNLDKVVKQLYSEIAELELKTNENTEGGDLDEYQDADVILASENGGTFLPIRNWGAQDHIPFDEDEQSDEETQVLFPMPDFDSSTTESLRESLQSELVDSAKDSDQYMHYRCIQLIDDIRYNQCWYTLSLESDQEGFFDTFYPQTIRYERQEDDQVKVHFIFVCDKDLTDAKLNVYLGTTGIKLSNRTTYITVKNVTTKRVFLE
uniref:Chromosome segregation ATPase n=1 Tax=Clandestinovirus TaxID=2831644 RepID=A0A8F8PN44_9VIRU|nr:chromosome segregation ATPase [Clandestinovirus]